MRLIFTILLLLLISLLTTSCETVKDVLTPASDVSSGTDGFDEAAVRLFDPKLTAQ